MGCVSKTDVKFGAPALNLLNKTMKLLKAYLKNTWVL